MEVRQGIQGYQKPVTQVLRADMVYLFFAETEVEVGTLNKELR